jgi:hypothetical protein
MDTSPVYDTCSNVLDAYVLLVNPGMVCVFSFFYIAGIFTDKLTLFADKLPLFSENGYLSDR